MCFGVDIYAVTLVLLHKLSDWDVFLCKPSRLVYIIY